MKIKLFITTIACLFIFSCSDTTDNADPEAKSEKKIHTQTFSNTPITDEGIASLRGVYGLRKLSITPVENKWIKEGDYDVSFDSQPPLIPHKSEYMRVTLTNNKCLDCHSNANYKEEEAAKMPASHFKTRTGERLKKASPRRYFCKQCHVSQIDAKPLIENTYVNTDE